MAESRSDKLVEEIRFNEKYAHLFYSEYIPEQYDADSLPTIKKKTLFTKDYIERLTGEGVVGGVLPPNCRYIEEMDKGFIVVIEEPPAFRTIKSDYGLSSEISYLKAEGKLDAYGYTNYVSEHSRPYTFQLAFPYVIFILYISKYNEIHDGQAFLRTHQMSGKSDYLLKMPMCNISDSGHICFGNKISGRFQSLTAAIQQAIMVWWSASFNTDYTYNYKEYQGRPTGCFLEWQYLSQTNPMFIYGTDWIKMSYTLGQRIEQTKEHLSLTSKRQMGYRDLSKVFYSTQDTGKEEKAAKRSRKTTKLFYDIAQGTFLDENTNITVGDSFETSTGKIAFIDSFIGFADGSDIRYIQLDIDGKKTQMKLTKNSRHFLAAKITEQRRADKAVLPSGVVVEPGQILIVKQGEQEIFRKADYIRKSRGFEGEEILEIKMGNSYHLTSNLEAKIFNVEEPEVSGIKLDKSEQYIIVDMGGNQNGKIHASRMRFDSIDIARNQQIVAKFKNAHPALYGDSRTIQLSKSSDSHRLYKIEDAKRLSGLFRVGRKLYVIPSGSKSEPKEECVWAINGITAVEPNFSISTLRGEYTSQLVKEDRFFVEGADFDTEFVIGDKVVVANWSDPLDVLTVKMLTGYKVSPNGDIHFILMDKEEKLSEAKYVDGKYGIIYTGKIRKVTNKVGRLSAGTKISATIAGIPCFPKKDTNIIVAFIIDTGTEPLVLCSNGCTLWFNDVMDHFKRTTMKSKKWATLEHAPLDLSKIKFQAGDIINGQQDYKTNYGYLLYGPSTTRALRAMPVEYLTGYPESYSLDRYMTRECRLDCIPAPRISPAKIAHVGVLRGYLNLHSFDVFEHHFQTRYLNQRRA